MPTAGGGGFGTSWLNDLIKGLIAILSVRSGTRRRTNDIRLHVGRRRPRQRASHRNGKYAIAKAKRRLDRIVAALRAEERAGEGTLPEEQDELPRRAFHDLRRTVRTRLAGLGVPDVVAELVIAHKQQGVRAVYDLHRYDKEKRDALERWERALLSILEPPPENVVPLRPGVQQ